MRVLHIAEGALDMMLSSVAQDNLLLAPVLVIGEENGLTQLGSRQARQRAGVGAKAQGRHCPGLDLAAEQFFEELAAQNLLDGSSDRLHGWFFAASGFSGLASSQGVLQFMELAPSFVQVGIDSLHLSLQKMFVVGD